MKKDIKKKIVIGAVIAVAIIAAVLGLLAYYQSQGIVKIFPDDQDRQMKAALVIDESKFIRPEGLPDEKYQQIIQKMEDTKVKIEENKADGPSWFYFGSLKSDLNDHEGAVLAWKVAEPLLPMDFRITSNIANAYQYFIKDFAQAEVYYWKAVEQRPDLTTAYEGLMDLYRFNLKEKQDQYEPMIIKAIENDSANTLLYYTALTEFYADPRSQNLDKAKMYLEKVRELKPERAEELIKDNPDLLK